GRCSSPTADGRGRAVPRAPRGAHRYCPAMTVVFVHGVPETAAVWDPLVAALDRDDVACLALPGFGSPLPEGFEPTMYRYADWLAEELTAFDHVDLVAHDWGALLAMRVLADAPSNVRTWVIDTGDLGPDHKWHA